MKTKKKIKKFILNMNKRRIRKVCKEVRRKKSLNIHLNESKMIQKRLFSEVDFSKYKNLLIFKIQLICIIYYICLHK